ncbi:hypothetical protein K402DRAFT_41368 [Aulographum hederae CBS 113979]|uniref:Uncharacterized protein n=1 Tax=Aulographum hederae CBS 113979 TaxID=1176131 RepID=A0A6G1H583_9PEZI|nr:hypothetical protein K402DRAFT_41368 [Aulographum hederae CBS 113979]
MEKELGIKNRLRVCSESPELAGLQFCRFFAQNLFLLGVVLGCDDVGGVSGGALVTLVRGTFLKKTGQTVSCYLFSGCPWLLSSRLLIETNIREGANAVVMSIYIIPSLFPRITLIIVLLAEVPISP